jgi:hypothetical protein
LSRHIIRRYTDEWIVEINDLIPQVRKMYSMIQAGQTSKARELLPREKIYPLDARLKKRLGMK